ncbi:hypothetical protein PC119_g10403 [Phytophthora cactorum]|uniref:Uncharacterized protein n=1 Tax=Phytophthora cactorum TaxID=29920 RepID=A0A8T1CFQ7_9STRA|nr:hypothetical protein PC117_g17027 [Phytophthora cactorum]KAG3019203.1 hypothetical protein PC119_g10403 [Phytophthora cactorum]
MEVSLSKTLIVPASLDVAYMVTALAVSKQSRVSSSFRVSNLSDIRAITACAWFSSRSNRPTNVTNPRSTQIATFRQSKLLRNADPGKDEHGCSRPPSLNAFHN